MLVNEFLETSAALYPDKVALVCGGRRLTYREIDRMAGSLAGNVLEAGFRKHDRAIIYHENSVETVVSLFGVLKAGGVFAIVNPQVKSRKLESILASCEPSLMITGAANLEQAAPALASFPSLKLAVVTGHERTASRKDAAGPDLLGFDTLLRKGPPGKPAPSCIDTDLAGLVYTSGSTGAPKGVMLTHLNIVSAARSIAQYLGNTAEDIVLGTLPLAFSYGLFQVLVAFMCGATVVLEKSFVYPQQVINLVVRERVTGWPMVPTIAAILLRLNGLSRYDFSHLRYVTTAGQAMSPRHLALLQQAFPGARIFSMYGLTECVRVSYLPPGELAQRPGSVGKPMPNMEAYLVNGRNQEITRPWKAGELVVRGANVMKGYWRLPRETARALRPGRFPGEKVLHTGDIFQMDEEGYLYFLGRKDDIIKTAGHMVSPGEVEGVLCEHQDIVEAAVIGVDDEILGKSVTAFVQLADGSAATEKDIIRFCSERLEDYAVPKNVVMLEALPKTSSGKIARRELKW